MKLDVTGAPAPAPWPVIDLGAQVTTNVQITAVRRARLEAARRLGTPADYHRALRAVLGSRA